MYNPLHFDHTEMVQQTEMGSLKAGQVPLDGTFREESNAEDFCHVPAFNTFGKEDPVHCWSVDDVVSWVQENVPIQSERLEGILVNIFVFFLSLKCLLPLYIETLRSIIKVQKLHTHIHNYINKCYFLCYSFGR